MGWLEAVSSWIGSLAWPGVVLVLGLVFRHRIGAALRKLRHLEAPGVKADFGVELEDVDVKSRVLEEQLNAAERQAEELPPAAPPEVENEPVEEPRVSDPSTDDLRDPSAVILREWNMLRNTMIAFANKNDVVLAQGLPAAARGERMLAALRSRGVLTGETAELFEELSELRNVVAYGDHVPTPGEAITYAETTGRFLRLFVSYVSRHGQPLSPTPQPGQTYKLVDPDEGRPERCCAAAAAEQSARASLEHLHRSLDRHVVALDSADPASDPAT